MAKDLIYYIDEELNLIEEQHDCELHKNVVRPNTSNYYRLCFVCPESICKLNKIVNLESLTRNCNRMLDENNTCMLPDDFYNADTIRMQVFIEMENDVVASTNAINIPIRKGGVNKCG
uniref:Uncharacterized protein n=1 Tax=Dulem virus 36 TaxID=3145754 RepID=A0AAU8AYE2_9CAUD